MENFEEMAAADDLAIQKMLKAMDMDTLATALKGASPEVHEKITKNMSERACAELEKKISSMKKVKNEDVEECQTVIMSYMD